MDWVWVVGGGRIQAPLIKEYINRGFHVMVGDRDLTCYANRIPDVEVFMVDTEDAPAQVEAVKRLAAHIGTPPAAVMTAGTDVGPTVSAIAATFHLPAVPYEVALRVKNKALMRAALNLPHPWWSYKPLAYPCIVKPTMKSASRGISLVTNPEGLEVAINFAMYGGALDSIIFEEALGPNDEASTDWMVIDSYPVYINGAARRFSPGTFIEAGWVNPFSITDDIQALACHAAKRLGVTEGPFKIDLIHDRIHGWCVLECATRWSGSFDHTIGATISTSRNLSSALVDYSLGVPFDSRQAMSHVNVNQYASGYTPLFMGDYLITTEMLTTIKASPGVTEVIPMRWSGSAVSNLAERPLFVIAKGPTKEKAIAAAEGGWQSWLEYDRTTNLGGGLS